mmetsp:Transcript_22578/g.56654  ORF Transcript_22578/g.56654 Transcript_22578/m.56654 type:complete len:364 (-) Transcript_22578:139-1230(-)
MRILVSAANMNGCADLTQISDDELPADISLVAFERFKKIKKRKASHSDLTPTCNSFDWSLDHLNERLPTCTEDIQLNTYKHQVAGHDAIFKGSSGKILKPLKKRELWFYVSQSSAPFFRAFAPMFHGCVHYDVQTVMSVVSTSEPCSKSSSEEPSPWSVQMQKARMLEFQEFNGDITRKQYYMVLEDLTDDVKHPCILDLKMGTRQHGDDSEPEKVRRAVSKCKRSTSSSLGFRIQGMQVWNNEAGKYWYMHKYEGMKVTKDLMTDSIFKYFKALPHGRRRIILKSFLAKMEEMLSLFASQKPDVRMYSTSLLFVYDGCSDGHTKVDVRVIDFDHTFPSDGKPDDSGFMLGMQSIVSVLKQLE